MVPTSPPIRNDFQRKAIELRKKLISGFFMDKKTAKDRITREFQSIGASRKKSEKAAEVLIKKYFKTGEKCTACKKKSVGPDPKNPGEFICFSCGYRFEKEGNTLFPKTEMRGVFKPLKEESSSLQAGEILAIGYRGYERVLKSGFGFAQGWYKDTDDEKEKERKTVKELSKIRKNYSRYRHKHYNLVSAIEGLANSVGCPTHRFWTYVHYMERQMNKRTYKGLKAVTEAKEWQLRRKVKDSDEKDHEPPSEGDSESKRKGKFKFKNPLKLHWMDKPGGHVGNILIPLVLIVLGFILSAILGSVLFVFAFLALGVSYGIPTPETGKSVLEREKKIRKSFQEQMKNAETEEDRERLSTEMLNAVKVEDIIGSFKGKERFEMHSRVFFKDFFKAVGIILMSSAFVFSAFPMAPVIGIIIGFVGYFTLGGSDYHFKEKEEEG